MSHGVLSSRGDDRGLLTVQDALAFGVSLRPDFMALEADLVEALAPDRARGSEAVVLVCAKGVVSLALQWVGRDGRPHVELVSRVLHRV